jgi:KDO2-lipid IV(A) lauroyltransferase
MTSLEDDLGLASEARSAPANRDLRMGGTWSRPQRLKNDVLFGLAMLALAAARALPLGLLRSVGRGLGAAAHALARGARRTARANVARVFPEMRDPERRALVRRTFVTMGELLADAVALLRPGAASGPLIELTPEARAVMDDARREGRGVLFASAHLGPWERVAASLGAEGFPFAALARESYDPRFSRLYETIRATRGVSIVWRARTLPSSKPSSRGSAPPTASTTSIAAMAGVLRTLRSGGVLGVPMDLRSRVPSCDVPFLGHTALTPVGPARIALRSGAAVVVGTVAPTPLESRGPPGDRSRGLVITATRIPTYDLEKGTNRDAQVLTARINDELSNRIRALPHAWVWMHDRWRAAAKDDDRIAGEPLT